MSGLYDILKQACSNHPDSIAVVDGPRRMTYAQVGRRVQALAAYLASRGVGRGDRLAIIDGNVLHIGDHIDEFGLVTINADEVHFVHDPSGRKVALRLPTRRASP